MADHKTLSYKQECTDHLAEWRTRVELLRARAEALRLTSAEVAAEGLAILNEQMALIEQELKALDSQSPKAFDAAKARIEVCWKQLEEQYADLCRTLDV